MKEKKLNPNWDIVWKALGKEPQTVDFPKNPEPAERHDAPKPGIMTLPLDALWPFPDHPYKVIEDESLDQLAESIRENGILSPVIVRPVEGTDEYEIISGHRRCRAAEMIGLRTVPVVVSDISPDEAVIQMVDSNLHREHLLPSEKAFAYKMKLEAMRRQQGERTDLTSVPAGQKFGLTSRELLASNSPDSNTQIQRYIRLTSLLQPLLNMVDEGKIAMRPAVELSYLSEQEQTMLYEMMELEDCTPSHAQAIKMRRFSEEGRLNEEVILSIMQEEKPNQKEQFRMPKERISRYFSPGTPAKTIEDTIIKALELYRKRQRSAER